METLSFKIIEKHIKTIFDAIEHNLSIMDKDLNILWINKAYAERLGRTPEYILGKKCYFLWHKRNNPCENCPCVKALKTLKVETEEVVSNEGRHYLLVAIPIIEEGEIKAIFEIGKEITKKKIFDEKFRELIKLEGIYEIVDNLAHQLNNIFNGIYGFIQLLKENTKDRYSLNFIEKIIKSVEKGSNFTKALLALKSSPSVKKVFDLNFLIISIKDLLKEITGEKIKIEFLLSHKNLLIEGDPVQIREVIFELVKNARNAISEDGVILISTDKINKDEEEKVILQVSDNGVGMDEETLKRCFEPLFTQDPRRFGLGLSIVKNIVQKHNGFIEIESSPSTGTTVRIFFPSVTLQQEPDI
ncbi:MAG: ATP-binding protein [Thermodesulfovibrio sp.]|nr:ATP-binding protein [Thermodesulfovibrio sp.]MCX7724674.1 ATP-binding protein [Thermodesulfovibrio sp.]MDW7971865.1 ATP-binding protein [Thermodesulfovibrio sp.]